MVWLPERDREENRGNPLNTQPQAESSVIRSSKPKVKGMQTEAHFGFFISQLPKMVLSHLLLGYLVSRRSLPASDVNLGAGWISDIVHRPLHPSPHRSRLLKPCQHTSAPSSRCYHPGSPQPGLRLKEKPPPPCDHPPAIWKWAPPLSSTPGLAQWVGSRSGPPRSQFSLLSSGAA